MLDSIVGDKSGWYYAPKNPVTKNMVYSREIERVNSKGRKTLSQEKRLQLEKHTEQMLLEEKLR